MEAEGGKIICRLGGPEVRLACSLYHEQPHPGLARCLYYATVKSHIDKMLSRLVTPGQNKDWVNSATEIYILEVLQVGSPRSRSQHSQRVPFLTSRQIPSNCVLHNREKASFLIPLL